jgi:hypothetical protein
MVDGWQPTTKPKPQEPSSRDAAMDEQNTTNTHGYLCLLLFAIHSNKQQ